MSFELRRWHPPADRMRCYCCGDYADEERSSVCGDCQANGTAHHYVQVDEYGQADNACHGDLHCHVSTSVLTSFDTCPFKVLARKIFHQVSEPPPGRGLIIGRAAHDLLEMKTSLEAIWAASETEESPGVMPAAVAWCAVPGTPLSWRREFYLDHLDIGLGMPFVGYVDLLSRESDTILDYKFGSEGSERWPGGFYRLPKTPEAIQKDLQLNLYAASIRELTGHLPTVYGQIQVNYDNGLCETVKAPVTEAAVSAAVEKAKKIAAEIRRQAVLPMWEIGTAGLPGGAEACKRYGSLCEAADLCSLVETGVLGGRRNRRKGWVV